MAAERPWLAHYPAGVPAEIDPDEYPSVSAVFERSVEKFRDRPAFTNFGKVLTYGEVDALSAHFAAWLIGELGLKRGDRIALMMPNCLQYPIAIFGALRAGLTVVNVNPLYTPHELNHQLVDSGATTIVVVDNFAHTVQEALPGTAVRNVVTTGLGDLIGGVKGALMNFVLRHAPAEVAAEDGRDDEADEVLRVLAVRPVGKPASQPPQGARGAHSTPGRAVAVW